MRSAMLMARPLLRNVSSSSPIHIYKAVQYLYGSKASVSMYSDGIQGFLHRIYEVSFYIGKIPIGYIPLKHNESCRFYFYVLSLCHNIQCFFCKTRSAIILSWQELYHKSSTSFRQIYIFIIQKVNTGL